MADTKVEKILEALITHAAGVIDADCWYVALYNKITAELDFPPTARRVMAALNMDEERWISRPYRPSDFLPDRIFADAKTVLIERDLKGWLKTHKAKLYQTDTPPLSWLGVPLMARGKVLGVVVAENYRGEPAYEDKTREFLSAMVQRAAGALANARLVESLRAASEVGQRLTSGIRLSRDEILELIYEQASRLMDTRNMYVALYDEEKQELSFPLAMQNGERKSWSSAKVNITIGAEGGLTEVVIRTKSPLCPLDVEAEYQKRAITPRVLPIPKSWLGVPMMIENMVIGVIALQNDDVAALYGQDDLEVLQAMAAQAAVAIENARLLAQESRLVGQLAEKVKSLEEAQNEIADRERDLVITTMAADFVHKVNNLAGTIPNWVALTKRLLDPESEQDKQVLVHLERIAEDTRFLLREARQLWHPLPEPEEIDVEELVASIVGQMKLIASLKVEFVLEAEGNLGRVRAVSRHLSDALFNVIDNGMKAITGKGQVSVNIRRDAERPKEFVRIDIADTGCGIPADKLAKIFDLGKTYRSGSEGTGYGLWRARNIVEGIGGYIRAESTVGKGSTFYITLPVVSPIGITNSEDTI